MHLTDHKRIGENLIVSIIRSTNNTNLTESRYGAIGEGRLIRSVVTITEGVAEVHFVHALTIVAAQELIR